MNPEEKIRKYFREQRIKKGEPMRLKDMAFECKKCGVYFTPNADRAKHLMTTYSVINKCRQCEKGG
tara:strand:+ start:6433 stop:6630 length:198 start_codon:yes stop_codon:yes gene_type:complete